MVPFFRWQTAIDFLVLAAVFYGLLRWARSARALRLALSVFLLHALAVLARRVDLVITGWVLDALAILTVVLLLLIFQSELRSAFMRLDNILRRWPRPAPTLAAGNLAVAQAAFQLAQERTGALLVIARQDTIAELITGGVTLGAEISPELLTSIFQKTSPLHDGAVIIRSDRVSRAGAVLPLTQRLDIAGYYGTRHRAGMGLAERCDCLVVVVSEERGEVTLMMGGSLRHMETPDALMESLERLAKDEPKRPAGRIYSYLFANLGLKLGALGLAGAIWTISFLTTGATVRTVTVPLQFDRVPRGMEVAEQSVDQLEVQLRGSAWLMDSINFGNLVARFDLTKTKTGWNTLQLVPETLDLPPGLSVDRVTPPRVRVRISNGAGASGP